MAISEFNLTKRKSIQCKLDPYKPKGQQLQQQQHPQPQAFLQQPIPKQQRRSNHGLKEIPIDDNQVNKSQTKKFRPRKSPPKDKII